MYAVIAFKQKFFFVLTFFNTLSGNQIKTVSKYDSFWYFCSEFSWK